jgi:hypothetical protein
MPNDEETPDDETITDVDVNEIYTTISEFFESEKKNDHLWNKIDESKEKDFFFESEPPEEVKHWIQDVVEKNNLTDVNDFLNHFSDAADMEKSYYDFKTDEESEESESEEKESEETSEPEESEEKDETNPMSESRKKRIARKRLHENEANIWWTSSSGRLEIEFDMPREEAIEIIDECSMGGRDADPYVTRQIRNRNIVFHINTMSGMSDRKAIIGELVDYGTWDRDELESMSDDELKRKILWIACCDLADSEKYNQFGDEDLTESRKTRRVVKEAYSEDLSRELQDVITARQSQTDPEVIQQLDAVIAMMKEKLKAPAQQIVKSQTPVQESIRDRIRKRLAKK